MTEKPHPLTRSRPHLGTSASEAFLTGPPAPPLTGQHGAGRAQNDDVPTRPHRSTGKAVVALGGGHGLSASLSALRLLTSHLTAIVTVADDGGSSGRLREELGVLPPGDLRMALSALCDDSDWGMTWRDVMQHRFGSPPDRSTPLEGHALGNLLIVTLWELLGDPVEGLRWAGALLRAQGQVLPMSVTPLIIEGDVADDSAQSGVRTVTGQAALAKEPYVRNVRLQPPGAVVCKQALDAVESADAVILGPGSWHTSVLPHVLLPELRQALSATEGRRVITMNLSRDTETEGKTSAEELQVLHEHAPELHIDAVVADPTSVEDQDHLQEVAGSMGATVHLADLRRSQGEGVHSPFKLAAAYQEVLGAW
ncbi:uridine diphosphate-N-acetylglucosamine-binding protein YvcK [Kocuria coralli]|uniref:Putative gluconeogenesis factor n=1 Tax=Kocuria coralli TaxID=1461025 RepID=A0A5J5KZ98_9MICC|nr:uridine diphosphate-N-acetylglucosamine-binding protein YvcK [Kocuria coralli]KAA9394989.1 uridine diphosphate-N-acetylglucosamine-binding protein YvcK [Kocuria coralli]